MPCRCALCLAFLAALPGLSPASAEDLYCLRNGGAEPVLFIAEQANGARRARPTAPGATWCVRRAELAGVSAVLDEMAVEAACHHAPAEGERGLTLAVDGDACTWEAER